MIPSVKSWLTISEPSDVSAGAMPSGTSYSRNGPSKIGSGTWYARWQSKDVPRKPLNSVPGSENARKNGGAWCVSRIIAPAKCTYSAYSTFVASPRNSSSHGKYSIP